MKKLLTLISILFYYDTQAQYQEGLDPYFGTKGIVTHSETLIDPAGFDNGILQPDGKIIAASNKHIVRFNTDGTLDNSFGVGGVFHTPVSFYYRGSYYPFSYFYIDQQLLLQPDGKLICVGYGWVPAPYNYAILLRLLPNGTLDPSFGEGGIVCDSSSRDNNDWTSALLMTDGKILLVANTDTASTRDYTVFTRYKSNGVRDSSFGIDGFVTTPQRERLMGDVELQTDGKILVLSDGFSVARYHPDGRPDSTFNDDGYNKIFSGSIAPFSTAMGLRPDGKIWLAGCTLFESPTLFILSRFNADGSIDSTFNEVGYKEYVTDTGDENKLRDMLLQPDGKVVLGGRVMNRATKQYNFGLMRIHPDGLEDSTFGDNGRLLTAPNGSAEASADLSKLLLQSDGKILGLGTSNTGTRVYIPFSTIVRYYGNGMSSIAVKSNQYKFSVFPNPASNTVNIKLPNATSIEHLSIVNMQGQVIKFWVKPTLISSMDVSDMPNGIYFIGVKIDGIKNYQKLIIQN